MTEDELRFPIGKFTPKENYTTEDLQQCIRRIEALPAKIEEAAKTLTPAQLNTPYREGGWTLRQVLHHIPESHMNAYIRFKWALTEDTPTIKAYNEKAWAETPEIVLLDPRISIDLLKALHVKWVALLKSLSPKDLQKQYLHPDTKRYNRLDNMVAMYAWHGEHHLAHITSLKERMRWS
ncbi:MAG TPA: putative metal-dependent hydrolase [Cyclobacteriaceae bacterium]|nr:putative metal-dependent hydrolase [Cyclobacteriaceae bacterium]